MRSKPTIKNPAIGELAMVLIFRDKGTSGTQIDVRGGGIV